MPATHLVTHLNLLPSASRFPKFPAHGHHYSSPVHPSGFNAALPSLDKSSLKSINIQEAMSMVCQFVVVFELAQV